MEEILHANTLLIPLPKKRARSLEETGTFVDYSGRFTSKSSPSVA